MIASKVFFFVFLFFGILFVTSCTRDKLPLDLKNSVRVFPSSLGENQTGFMLEFRSNMLHHEILIEDLIVKAVYADMTNENFYAQEEANFVVYPKDELHIAFPFEAVNTKEIVEYEYSFWLHDPHTGDIVLIEDWYEI
jgi:hypothetical protein